MDGWMGEWNNGWVNGWMEGRMDYWMDEIQMVLKFYKLWCWKDGWAYDKGSMGDSS